MANGTTATRSIRIAQRGLPMAYKEKQMKVSETVLDLNTMEEVKVIKPVPDFKPADSTHDALARMGNDTKRFLKIINDGLELEERNAVKNDPNVPWQTESEDGTLVPFDGVACDWDKFSGLRMGLAKSIFGYPSIERGTSESVRAELKAKQLEAKSAATDMIKNTPAIVERLKTVSV